MSPPPKIAIVSVDGINLSSRFILKEMSIRIDKDESYRHFIFNRPADLVMTLADKKTEEYAKRVLGAAGIDDYSDGSLDYYSHIGILYSLANYKIFCAGHVSYKFLSTILPYADIYDIQEISSHTFPKQLPTAWCGISHNPRYCSLAKLWNIVNFVHNVLETDM